MLKVSRVLHAGYIFESQGVRVLVDPLFETPFSVACHADPPVRFDFNRLGREVFDAVVISHYHDDHCSFESLQHIDRATPIYMFCLHDEMFTLLREFGFESVLPLKLRESIRIASLEITAWPALDRDVDCLLQITDGHTQVLNVVDSWIDFDTVDELSRIKWDLILWPFQTMLELDVLSPSRTQPASRELPPEWLDQLRTLNPRAVVPSSCQFNFGPNAWQNSRYFPISYAQFARELATSLPGARVLRLKPGESLLLHEGTVSRSEPLPFVLRTGASTNSGAGAGTVIDTGVDSNTDCDYDYEYDFNVQAPSLSDVARELESKLPSPHSGDSAKLLEPSLDQFANNFLANGLILKYRALDEGAENYFDKPRRWDLRLFKPNGDSIDAEYLVSNSSIEHLKTLSISQSAQSETEWLTEIPLVKLHAALNEGESLTSILIRINDCKFSEQTESELEDVDFLADPLLRVLYENQFASYQKAQIQRLKNSPLRVYT